MNGFDLSISSFINGFAHRSLRFDEFVVFLSNSHLLKGGVVIGLVWWLWFQNGDVRSKREALLAAVIASFPALAVARILSWVFFRPRPLNEARFLFRVPYGATAVAWEGLSSFPSDHAVLFFALATGIFFVSRRAGWFTFAYVSIIICLPRIFIGVHYTTDILAGAAIGGSMAWLANLSAVRKPLTSWALQWQNAKPEQFYCFSFILTYQMAEQFDPLLKILKVTKFIIQGKLLS
jgi:membrane-associated phospholipid phosphatase